MVGLTLNGAPLPTNVPPQEPVYHFHEAFVPNDPPLILKLVEPPGQRLSASEDAEEGGVEGMQHAVTEILWDWVDELFCASVTVSETVLLPKLE